MTIQRRQLTPGLLAVLGLLAAIGPLSTDFYLSSFTGIARDLNASASEVQLTLTGALLGIAVGQLLLGPASDRYGRRPVMLAAIAVFALTSILIACNSVMWLFIALRVLQGAAGAAGIVVSRAIAVDLSDGDTAVRALSLIAMVSAVGPIVAPLLGGSVAAFWGWRGALWALAIIAVLLWLLAWAFIPESLAPELRQTGGAAAAVRNFGGLLADRPFAGFMLTFAIGYAAMMAYISASPFVVQSVLGFGVFDYALSFAAGAVAFFFANLVNSSLAPRVGPARMLTIGQALALGATTTALVLVLTNTLQLAMLVPIAFVLTAGTGLTMANASALALSRAPHARGAGAALIGSVQFAAGAAVAPLTGAWGEHTAVPMAVIMVACVALALGAAVFGRRALRRVHT